MSVALFPLTEANFQKALRGSARLNLMSEDIAHGISMIRYGLKKSTEYELRRWNKFLCPDSRTILWTSERAFKTPSDDFRLTISVHNVQGEIEAQLLSVSIKLDSENGIPLWENGKVVINDKYIKMARRALPSLMTALGTELPQLAYRLRLYIDTMDE